MASEWEFIQHGDAEAAVVDILLNYTPELAFSTGRPTISTNLIGYEYDDRRIMVSQEGAFESARNILNHPRIDVECWAEKRSVAHDMADICLASIQYQGGRYRGNGLYLAQADLEMGITKAPDRRQGVVRYIFALRLTTRPSGSLTPPS